MALAGARVKTIRLRKTAAPVDGAMHSGDVGARPFNTCPIASPFRSKYDASVSLLTDVPDRAVMLSLALVICPVLGLTGRGQLRRGYRAVGPSPGCRCKGCLGTPAPKSSAAPVATTDTCRVMQRLSMCADMCSASQCAGRRPSIDRKKYL